MVVATSLTSLQTDTRIESYRARFCHVILVRDKTTRYPTNDGGFPWRFTINLNPQK